MSYQIRYNQSVCSTEESLLRDFQAILKHSLQNCSKILKKNFLSTDYNTSCINDSINDTITITRIQGFNTIQWQAVFIINISSAFASVLNQANRFRFASVLLQFIIEYSCGSCGCGPDREVLHEVRYRRHITSQERTWKGTCYHNLEERADD